MNIKSNLSKPILWFKSITLGSFLFALIVGFALSISIVAAGWDLVLKLMFLILGGFVALMAVYDGHKYTNEQKDGFARKNGMIIILAFFISEIGLFISSSNTYTIPISAIVTDEIRTEIIKKDGNGVAIETKEIPYKKVTYYNLDNNKNIGYRDIEKGQEAKLAFLTNVTQKEYYIVYTPFIKYSEEFRYIREK